MKLLSAILYITKLLTYRHYQVIFENFLEQNAESSRNVDNVTLFVFYVSLSFFVLSCAHSIFSA